MTAATLLNWTSELIKHQFAVGPSKHPSIEASFRGVDQRERRILVRLVPFCQCCMHPRCWASFRVRSSGLALGAR